MLVWPDTKQEWYYRDRAPNVDAMKAAEAVYRRVAGMSAEKPLRLKFAPDAQALFVAWLTDLETRLRADDTEARSCRRICRSTGTDAPRLLSCFQLPMNRSKRLDSITLNKPPIGASTWPIMRAASTIDRWRNWRPSPESLRIPPDANRQNRQNPLLSVLAVPLRSKYKTFLAFFRSMTRRHGRQTLADGWRPTAFTARGGMIG